MVKGDKCWIIENGRIITSVEVLAISGNLVMIRTEYGKVLRLPKHRIYDTKDKAEDAIPVENIERKRKTPYEYM